ncbi:hypothetical protein ACFP3I_11105 [Chryseobacterium arachidis]
MPPGFRSRAIMSCYQSLTYGHSLYLNGIYRLKPLEQLLLIGL